MKNKNKENLLSIAPMMDRTDRHFRYFIRQITKHTLLYTEMISTAAIQNGNKSKLLDFSPEEKPLSLQLGGNDPYILGKCAVVAEDWGYDEVNLNVGCPSDRVQDGRFGACLMAEPELVAKSVEKMKNSVSIPITVKHRIGIDNHDDYDSLKNFVRIVSESGCEKFTVHARKAWLKGLSPKENRNIPPLRYQDVYRLKEDFPHLIIEINGGIISLEQVSNHLQFVNSVMLGRAAYDNPYLLATVDRKFYQSKALPLTRYQIIENTLPYIEYWTSRSLKLHNITRHLLALFLGMPGTKEWKKYIGKNSHFIGQDSKTILYALDKVKN
ncbi:MAG: tRNA-U16,U17-dihydrouridine synthase [Candidatus Atelocyanobacterium thalassa isolate SIO64986]|uniref:tRNA-dihydrouridine(20/20a) synthase n=1 Tax=Candidatus Atelocyanobacterium thalassa isolate SIO64986 TaxID=1527444 RepID=A0A086CGE0_9CHRO|nr:MAG: tRNA-U16,U17-dihydrouridine synthase [Candidatus Atelocyanobacterium thalassa isolate SIO64986]